MEVEVAVVAADLRMKASMAGETPTNGRRLTTFKKKNVSTNVRPVMSSKTASFILMIQAHQPEIRRTDNKSLRRESS